MNLLLITTLLVSGLCSLSSSVPCQFHVVKENKTWTEAQQYCREEFTDLATIDNMAEMKEVKRLIKKAGAGRAWIGLQRKWQWSLADRDLYRPNETGFKNWNKYQPNGQGPKGNFEDTNCVIQTGNQMNGWWNDYGCSETLPFICYDGVGDSTHPYVLVNEEKNWTDAQRYCREKHTDLASVRNQTENNQIKKVRGGKSVWIGLFKAWEWSDNSYSSFCHWMTHEPNNKDVACAEIQPEGRWNDAGCQHKINFICYEDKLVLVSDNKTWNEALQYCQEHYVDLVSVRSKRIQLWVQNLAKGASTDHVWLGLRHACSVGWFWVYGETVCYDNWAPGQEQVQDCQRGGAVKSGGEWGQEEGQWVSLPEDKELNFICTTEDL